jgi:hypothetical protein
MGPGPTGSMDSIDLWVHGHPFFSEAIALSETILHVSHDMSSKKDTENHTMSTPGINKQTSDVHIPNEEAVSLSSVVVFKMGEVHICSSTCLQ